MKVVAVTLLGKEYRIRSDADPEWLQEVARLVDQTLGQVRERTKTHDTLDVALLTSLNLARQVLASRGVSPGEPVAADSEEGPERYRPLIQMGESALEYTGGLLGGLAGSNLEDTALLTLPTGKELEAGRDGLLDTRTGSGPGESGTAGEIEVP